MKRKNIYRIIIGIFIAGSILGFNSCLDDTWDFDKLSDEILLTPELATPVAYGSLSLKDLLNEVDSAGDLVEEFDDSLLYIAYSQDLFSYPASDVVTLPEQDFIEAEVGIDPLWLALPAGDTITFEKRQDGVFDFENNEKLDSIYIKTADLEINVTSSFQHKGYVNIASDSMLLNGDPFEELIQISADDGTFDTTYTINLDGNKIYLDNSDPTQTYLPLIFELSLIKGSNPMIVGENCNITIIFKNVEFSSAYGYFGIYDLIVESGEVVLDIFDNEDMAGGAISFFDPQFALNVSNSYGLPVQIELTDVTAYSKINDVTTPIVLNDGNFFDILAPGIDSVGTSVNSVIEINSSNSNLAEVVETSPKKFNYTVSAITNPLGSTTDNFVTDSSSLEVGFDVILPMHFNADGFVLEDTLDFDFEDQFGDVVDLIEYFNLIMDVTNGLPMDVNMQLIFTDSLYTVLDSMFVDDQFLIAPSLDADDRVAEPEEFTKTVEFDSDKLERIRTAKFMLLRASVSTADILNDTYVKFFSFYEIGFKLKIDAGFNINTRDL